MKPVKPIYVIALLAAILAALFIVISNPYREFGTHEFWKSATLESVDEIPDEALEPGNRNGPVLMWAAMATNDPRIIEALVSRGADINEADGIFKGTPLTGAAGYSSSEEIIDVLIRLGADIQRKVHNNEDALMIAARYNNNPGIISRLIYHGADITNKNNQEKTALDIATEMNNTQAVDELDVYLESLMDK